jgi:dipeptidase E
MFLKDSMKKMIVASTSTLYGGTYLSYLKEELKELYRGVEEIVFVPYARPSGISWDDYTKVADKFFKTIGISVRGIHEFENLEEGIKSAQGIFVGGGNTFVLVKTLQETGLMERIKSKVEEGIPYLGTSAGSNICGPSMKTTNDMPIVMPTSFDCMSLIPFGINAHFLDFDPDSKHKGESRDNRIKEYHVYNKDIVIGLREGSWLAVDEDKIQLKGNLDARVFKPGEKPFELEKDSFLKF